MELELVPPGGERVHVVEQRQVVHDGVVRRDRHVVRQPRARQLHRHQRLERAVAVHHAIVHVRRLLSVGEEQELAGALVDLGMRRDRQAPHARIELQLADGGQVVRTHLVDGAPEVPHRHQVAGVELHIGVGGVLHRHVGPVLARRILDALPQGLAGGQFFAQAVGGDPAVLVLHPAAFETHRVQHAVAIEPVVAARRLEAAVGAVAHIHAVEVLRHLALDVGEVQRQLVVDRREAAGEDGKFVHAHGALLRWCRCGRERFTRWP